MSTLIEPYVAHLADRGYAAATIEKAARLLTYAAARLPFGLDVAHPRELASFLRGNRRWKAETRRNYHNHLVRFYAWAERNGYLTLDPMAEIRRPPPGRPIPTSPSIADRDRALDLSADPWQTAIMLAAFAGCRPSESAECDRDDVTEEMLTVRCGKGGRTRQVDTAPELWAFLRDRPPGRLITFKGQPVTGAWLSSRQRYHFAVRLGMPHLHLHLFRHQFATELLRAGVDVRVVQDLLGHASLTSTMVYLEVAAASRRSAVRLLPARGAGREPAVTRLAPLAAAATV